MPNSACLQITPRPFLKWAGGKSQLLPQYQPYFPKKKFNNYFEPFLGGGAVFFHLQPSAATLTDINPELINAYIQVQNHVEELILLLEEHQAQHNQEYYYQIRSAKTANFTDIQRAARLIYLNKTCFNGLYRENSKGEFNVPLGKYKNPKICHPELLRSVAEILKSATIEEQPFDEVATVAQANDLVYFDPPYYPLSATSNFTAYSRNDFNEADQKRLYEVFVGLAKRNVKVMLSNSDCSFIRDLYSEFNIYPISATRVINSNAQKRGKVSEVLVTSYK
jgi:DNA adenine methylase